MSLSSLVNLSSLIDDAKCYELVRQHRWPEGVRCPHCDSASVARHGHDDTQRHRQRYRCRQCLIFTRSGGHLSKLGMIRAEVKDGSESAGIHG